MGSKNNPGTFDCYSNAEPDEPMFVLLGRDRHGPSLVRAWAAARQLEGSNPEKIAEARACASAMEEWLVKIGKVPSPVPIYTPAPEKRSGPGIVWMLLISSLINLACGLFLLFQ